MACFEVLGSDILLTLAFTFFFIFPHFSCGRRRGVNRGNGQFVCFCGVVCWVKSFTVLAVWRQGVWRVCAARLSVVASRQHSFFLGGVTAVVSCWQRYVRFRPRVSRSKDGRRVAARSTWLLILFSIDCDFQIFHFLTLFCMQRGGWGQRKSWRQAVGLLSWLCACWFF